MRRHPAPASAALALLVVTGSIPCVAQLPAPGTQDPVIDTRPDPVVRVSEEPLASGSLRLDNYQSQRVGRYAATAQLRLRNPGGFGDLATAQLRSTVTAELIEGAVSYSLPVNRAGTRLGVIAGGGQQEKGTETVEGEGDYTRVTVAGTHPFLRAHDRNLHGDLSLNHYEFRDDFDAARRDTTARHRFATGRLRGYRADRLLGGGRFGGYAEYQAGHVDRDARSDPLQFEGYFVRRRVRVERIQSVSRDSELSVSVFAQDASRNLAPHRGFALAGPHGVRAYPQSELSADEGYFARADYDVRLSPADGWTATGGVFWDGGRGKLNRNPLPGARNNTRTLSGIGTKFLIARPGWFDASIMLAWPTSGPSLRDGDRDPQVWLTATAYF